MALTGQEELELLELENENALSKQQTKPLKVTPQNAGKDFTSSAVDQAKDVGTGVLAGLADIPLSIANIVPSIQNLPKLAASLVDKAMSGFPGLTPPNPMQSEKMKDYPEWIKNPIQPKTTLGKITEIGTSFAAPTGLSKLLGYTNKAKEIAALDKANKISEGSIHNIAKLTNTPEYVAKGIIDNPALTNITPKKPMEIGNDLQQIYSAERKRNFNEFTQGINQFDPNSLIDTKPIAEGLTTPRGTLKTQYDPKEIISDVIAQGKARKLDTRAMGLEDKIITRKVINPNTLVMEDKVEVIPGTLSKIAKGQPITLEESRQANNLLAHINDKIFATENPAAPAVGEMKKLLLTAMDDSVPGIKNINRKFAAQNSVLDDLENTTHKWNNDLKIFEPRESVIDATAINLAGGERLKDVAASKIKNLDRHAGTNIEKIMKDNEVARQYNALLGKGGGNVFRNVMYAMTGAIPATAFGGIKGLASSLALAAGTGVVSDLSQTKNINKIANLTKSLRKIHPLNPAGAKRVGAISSALAGQYATQGGNE